MREGQRALEVERLAWVIERLEEAGETLLALPAQRTGPQLRQARWPETVAAEAAEDDVVGMSGRQLRPAMPTAAQISRMDEAFGWIGLIPAECVMIRRILHARSLVSPLTGRHLYSWRKLGGLLGADHKAVQRWHRDGLAHILAGLKNMRKSSC